MQLLSVQEITLPCSLGARLSRRGSGDTQPRGSLGKLSGLPCPMLGTFCPPLAELCFLGFSGCVLLCNPSCRVGGFPVPYWDEDHAPGLQAGMGRDPDSAPSQALSSDLLQQPDFLFLLLFLFNQNGVREKATGKHFPKTESPHRKGRTERRQLQHGQPGHPTLLPRPL